VPDNLVWSQVPAESKITTTDTPGPNRWDDSFYDVQSGNDGFVFLIELILLAILALIPALISIFIIKRSQRRKKKTG
jgi:hypothetical protein